MSIRERTDRHVHVFPFDHYGDRPVDTVGLARTASLIQGVWDEATNAIPLDNGDFLPGNPMGDYMAYARGMAEGGSHPIIAAMNALGCDDSTLGNHEFNHGLDFLMNSLAGSGIPVLCADVVRGRGGQARPGTRHCRRPTSCLTA